MIVKIKRQAPATMVIGLLLELALLTDWAETTPLGAEIEELATEERVEEAKTEEEAIEETTLELGAKEEAEDNTEEEGRVEEVVAATTDEDGAEEAERPAPVPSLGPL